MVHNIAPDPQIPPTNDSNGNVTEKSGVGAAVSIGLAIASVISNIYSTIHTNRQNRELAEKENQWNIEQWKRETGYNSPSAQMQRLLSAGLNPSLMYQGGNFNNSAASSPDLHASVAPMKPVDLDPTSMSTVISNIHQNELMDSQSRLNQAQEEEVRASAGLKNAEANRISTLLPEEVKRFQASCDHLNALAKYYISMMSNVDIDTYTKRIDSLFRWDMNKAQLNYIQSNFNLNQQELKEKIQTFSDRWASICIENRLKQAKIFETRANTNLLSAQTETEQARRELVSWQANKMFWDYKMSAFSYQLDVNQGYAEKAKAIQLFNGIANYNYTLEKIATAPTQRAFNEAMTKYYSNKVWQGWFTVANDWRSTNNQMFGNMMKGVMLLK